HENRSMARQKIKPAYISANGSLTTVLSQAAFLENDIQTLVHQHPDILPLHEIDPAFAGAVSICCELDTRRPHRQSAADAGGAAGRCGMQALAQSTGPAGGSRPGFGICAGAFSLHQRGPPA
ncbi:hypothetical protein ACFSYD_26795, partial [Paracoccus aerius]|uniref:hypothetical protein n=1 Tax=Paracoccus aerius TaxID=1915382 RepID=UPI0036155001